jgi:hypothetical protein
MVCDTCQQVLTTEVLEKVPHSYQNNACIWCQKTPVQTNSLGALLTVQNNTYGNLRFMIDKNGDIYSDWRADYDDSGDFYIEMKFIANADVTLECLVSSMCEAGGICTVLINGEVEISLTGKTSKKLSAELKKGDEVLFTIYRDSNTSADNKMYVKDIKVTAVMGQAEE